MTAEQQVEQVEKREVVHRVAIDLAELRCMLDAVSRVVSETIFRFTPDGLVVRQLDLAEVSLVDIVMPPHCFESYEVEGAPKVTFRVDDLLKLIRNIKAPKKRATSERAIISTEPSQVVLTRVGFNGTSTYKVPRFTPDKDMERDIPIPKVEFSAYFRTPTEVIKNFLNESKHVGDTVEMEAAGEEKVRLTTRGEVSEVSVDLTPEDGTLIDPRIPQATKCRYDLNRLLKFVDKKLGEIVAVEYGEDKPIKLSYPRESDSMVGTYHIDYWLAPKIGSH